MGFLSLLSETGTCAPAPWGSVSPLSLLVMLARRLRSTPGAEAAEVVLVLTFLSIEDCSCTKLVPAMRTSLSCVVQGLWAGKCGSGWSAPAWQGWQESTAPALSQPLAKDEALRRVSVLLLFAFILETTVHGTEGTPAFQAVGKGRK